MKRIAQNKKSNKALQIFFFGIFATVIIAGCSSKGNDLFSNDKVKASSFDGSVEIVENFLKKGYLKNPDSYKSIQWGELTKHYHKYLDSPSCFLVTHTFSAKNVLGMEKAETMVFYISGDGQRVSICSKSEVRSILRDDKQAEENKASREYATKDFSNVLFEGFLQLGDKFIVPRSTFKGELTKVGNLIEGNVVAIDAIGTKTTYRLTGNIEEEDPQDPTGRGANFKLKNLSDGSRSIISLQGGAMLLNNISGWGKNDNNEEVVFGLTQSGTSSPSEEEEQLVSCDECSTRFNYVDGVKFTKPTDGSPDYSDYKFCSRECLEHYAQNHNIQVGN